MRRLLCLIGIHKYSWAAEVRKMTEEDIWDNFKSIGKEISHAVDNPIMVCIRCGKRRG